MVSRLLMFAVGLFLGGLLSYAALNTSYQYRLELVRTQQQIDYLNATRLMTCRQILVPAESGVPLAALQCVNELRAPVP